MKTLGIKRNIIVSIFAVMLLMYGVQGIGYAQGNAPTVAPGNTNTTLIVSFKGDYYDDTHQIQFRRKEPQGDWIVKCGTYKEFYNRSPIRKFMAIFTDLEPGTTYQARWRDTNTNVCVNNPPSPDPWSPIAEGTTLLENPPLVEFFDRSLAVAVRATLGLPINDATGTFDILKIPKVELTKLTKLDVHPTSLAGDLLEDLDLPNITDLTGLEHATQLRILDLTWHTGVTDLDPIAQLTQLRELNIYRTNVIDLTPIAQLTQLSKLDISGTHVVDLTPIAQLTQLKELRITATRVIDLTPLSGLTQLSKLDMWDTPINDLTPLAQLIRLTEIRITVYTTIAASDIRLLAASTPQPLTEATLNGSSVILTLLPSGASYDKSIDNLRNALTVSGIPGVIVSDVTRVNDTQVKVTLEFTGNLSLPDTLTFTISPEAVSGYDGRVLTDKITIYAPLELSVSHDTLTDVTLDGAIVTLTLASGAFHLDRIYIRDALTISGIPGIGIAKWSEIEIVGGYSGGRKEIKIKLMFTGDPITTDSILTLTVGPRAILNYNGPAYTLEIPVSAVPEAELSETELAELSKALVASTDNPLTATSLDGAIVTLRLTDGVYEKRTSYIEDALTISGIQGVVFGTHYSGWGWYENDVNRVSDTEITIELRFAGSINADSTLIFTVGPGAIQKYKGASLTTELPVSASSEIEVTGELVASTVFPLSANTLHGSFVKLTLKTKSFQGTDDAPHVKTSGVPGVSIAHLGWGSHIHILNKKEAHVLLSFNGNLDTDATLILSVPSRLIENYTGPPISAELPVTAKRVKQVHISEPSLLIYTDTDKIQLSPSGSVVQYESALQKTGLTVDAGEDKVYWSEQGRNGGTIKRANLDLTGVEVLATLPTTPYNLSIDTVGKRLYWINSSKREVQSAALNGENIQTVIDLDSDTTNIGVDGDITDIAVFAEDGKLYWADKYSIWNVNLDGTNAEIAVTGWGTSRTTGIGGIAIADGKIYWTGHQSGTGDDYNGNSEIHRANLNGTSTERLAFTYGKATSIAVDTAANKVYWANSLGGIQRVDIDGGEVEAVVSGITAPEDFVVVPGVQPTTPTTPEIPATTDAVVSISPASVPSAAVGEQLMLNLNITGGEAVAEYQVTVQFDDTALRYVSSANGDYLPAGAFFVQPVVEGNLVKLNAVSLSGDINGDGTLATLTFEVIAVKDSTLTLTEVLLTDNKGTAYVPSVENAEITKAPQLKGDVNGDGIVNIQDLVLVAGRLGQSGANSADVNGDGVVNIQDLVLVAGALGSSAAAPLLHAQDFSMLTAADVKKWLSEAQQLDLTDATSLRGILFLQQLLEALTPKETILLPNYPNPFNPETWIPYHLSKPANVTLTIYNARGVVVRELSLGHQVAGYYTSRSRAAYWDGTNEFGERVASGLYFYRLQADSVSFLRKMVILK